MDIHLDIAHHWSPGDSALDSLVADPGRLLRSRSRPLDLDTVLSFVDNRAGVLAALQGECWPSTRRSAQAHFSHDVWQ